MPINRVTFTSNVLLIRTNLLTVQKQYEKAAIAATTAKKINTLSDDSTVTSRLFTLRGLVVANDQYQKNIEDVNRKLNFTEAQLTSSSDILEQIRELGIQANVPTLGTDIREQLANQLADLKEQLLVFANAKLDNKYVFAGTASTTEPFADAGGGAIQFAANSTVTSVQVNASLQIETNLDGDEVFTGNVDDSDATTLATDLRDSQGVSLGINVGDIINFGGNVTGAIGGTLTVSAATDLDDIRAALQVAIRAAGAGTETVAIQADGSLRTTAGATAITGLTMSITGNTTFNTAFTFPTPIAIAGTGDSDSLLTGTGEDIFDLIDDLQEAVETGNQTDISTHLSRLDAAIDQILNARSLTGLRIQQLNSIETLIAEESIRTLGDLSNVEDASLDQVLSELVLRETALKVVFTTSSKVLAVTSNLQFSV